MHTIYIRAVSTSKEGINEIWHAIGQGDRARGAIEERKRMEVGLRNEVQSMSSSSGLAQLLAD